MIRNDILFRPLARGAMAAVAVSILVSGCTVGPDFHRPTPPPENSIVAGGPPPGVQVGGRIADDWYRLFGSPALNALVRRALQRNPDLKAARAAIGAAQYRLAATTGGVMPHVDGRLLGNRARINNGALTHIPQQGASVNNLFLGVLTLSYDLDPFGKLRRSAEAGRAQVDYARARALNTYVTLVDQVVRNAFALAAANARIDATRKLIEAERRRLGLVRLQESVGTEPRAATLTAQARLQGTQATLPALERARDGAAVALATLVGDGPAAFDVPPVNLADFKLPAKLPLSLPSQLIRQRPDILAAEAELHEASARIGIRAAQRLPDLTLSASYGTLSDQTDAFFDAANALWALNGQITAPLLHGGSLKARENQAKVEYVEAAARYRGTVLQAMAEVAMALRGLSHDTDTVALRRQALATARQALQLSSDQFSAGSVDELQVLAAQQEYRSETLSLIGAREQRFDDVAALFHALGGGWWNAAGDPVPAVTAHDYRTSAAAAVSGSTGKKDEH